MKVNLVLLLVFLLVQACITLNVRSGKILVEDDTVRSSKRINRVFYYYRVKEKCAPFLSLKQTVSKELVSDKNAHYYVYDVLSLRTSSFEIENKVYVMIDDAVFTIDIKNKRIEERNRISENNETVMTADSSSLSVVTGYTQKSWRDEKFKYELETELVQKIIQTKVVQFRYYSGPNMMTLALQGKDLKKFKEVLAAS